ncbi:MAG: glycosyltransferase family 2 protein [Candidatus Methanoperedens sp.]
MEKNQKVIACLPAYNEETSIGSVVLKTKRHVDKVIVIDDGSSDGTVGIVRLTEAEIVEHEKNRGYGAAIKSCFEAAKNEGADAMVIIDADGQHNPDEIPLVLAPVLAGEADMVIGSRFLENVDIPAYRRVGINVLTKLTNIGSKGNVSDSQSGFRAYSKEAINQLKFNANGMGVGSEILINAQELGLRIKEVPVTCKYKGVEGSTHNPVSHGISVFNLILVLIKNKHPLLFFGVPGIVFLSAGISSGISAISIYNKTGDFAIGIVMLSMVTTLVGVISIFSGLILDSIRTYK